MSHEEYQAFAPHGSTVDDPYWSDSEFNGRKVPVEIGLDMGREGARQYGARRAK